MFGVSARAGEEGGAVFGRTIVGGEFDYRIQSGDYPIILAARFGVESRVIVSTNHLASNQRLRRGSILKIDNRRIVPPDVDSGIIINVPQRMLYYLADGEVLDSYPVAVGRRTWQTRSGSFRVFEKREHPVWHVPPSIQREMEQEGKEVEEEVEPGPDNPLGDYWMGLSLDSYGIHATNRPGSIYGFRTHGCIRLSPADAKDLYGKVAIGTRGVIVYHPVLLARSDEGRIFLEVDKDQYHLGNNPLAAARALAESLHLDSQIDWNRAGEVADASEGIARDVSAP